MTKIYCIGTAKISRLYNVIKTGSSECDINRYSDFLIFINRYIMKQPCHVVIVDNEI